MELKRRVCLGVTFLLVGLLIVGCLGVGKKYSVSGTVVDSDGNGIAGVELLFAKGSESLGSVTTGEDGK